MKKALGIGEIVLDKSCILSSFPLEDSKVSPLKVKYSLGGPVPAALIVLSRLGVDCTLVASVGQDQEGQLITKKLAQEGIRIIGAKKKRTKINTYIINQKNGSRTGIKSEVVYKPIKKVPLDLLYQMDVIIADRHETVALNYAIENKNKMTKVVIDPSTVVTDDTIQMIIKADYPVLPIELLDSLPGNSREEKLAELFSIAGKEIIVTIGELGSFIYNGKNLDIIPPLDIKAVDRLGAGDVYRAGIAWGAMNGWDINKCAKYANVVSGLQCTRYGNGSAIPTKKEIEDTFINPKFKKVSIDELMSKS